MFLLMPRKGQTGNVSGVLGLIGKPPDPFVFFIGYLATNLKHLVDSATVTLNRFHVESAEASPLFAWR
jgi:hypothetical protein